MNYYSHHIGDYRRDTAHLSLLEHGVYRQLLDMYYLSETKIPAETEVVYRRLCARTEDEKRAVDTVLGEFFKLEDGWIQTRCDKVIAEYQGKAERARNNGKLGGRPSQTKEVISGNPKDTKEEANHKPSTKNHKPESKTKAPPSAVPDWMPIESWTGYLEMRKARKKVPTDRAVELLIGVLGKMREQGHDIAAVLDTSTKNCWTDVYLPKQGDGRSAQPGKFNGLNDIDHTSSRQAMERSVKQMGIPLSNDPTEPPVDF